MLNMCIYENSETVSVLSISLLGIIAFIRSHCDATRIDVHLVQSLPHSTHCHLDGGRGGGIQVHVLPKNNFQLPSTFV